MSYSRFCTLTADARNADDIIGYAGGSAVKYQLSSTLPFTGAYSYRGSTDASGMLFPNTVAARVSFMLSPNGMASSGKLWVALFRVNNTSVALEYDIATTTFVLRAGFVSGTTAVNYPGTSTRLVDFRYSNNRWYNVSLVAYLHDTNGFVSAYVDGVKVATWTGDTRIYESGSVVPLNQLSGFFLTGDNGADYSNYEYIDDIYCDIGDGSEADACPPTRRFQVSLPTANGATVEWTPNTGVNYAAVDDAPPDGETTFVYAEAPDLTDLYAYLATGLFAYSVKSVIVSPYAKKTDAAVASTLRAVASDANGTQQSAEFPLSVSYAYYQGHFPLAGDGQPWETIARVNAATFGVSSDGVYV